MLLTEKKKYPEKQFRSLEAALPKKRRAVYFYTFWFIYINKKAKLLDVGIPDHAEYLRQELLSLHEKYQVPLDSRSFDMSLRQAHNSWQRWLRMRKFIGKDRDAHKNIDESRERVFYNEFFENFASFYFNEKSLTGKLHRGIDKYRR